jgi:hypothetical protein
MADARRQQIEKEIMFLLYNAGMKDPGDRHERNRFVHKLESRANRLRGILRSEKELKELAEIVDKQEARMQDYYEQYKNYSAEDFLSLDMTSFGYLQKKAALRRLEFASLELSPEKLREYAGLAVDSGVKTFILELIPKKERFLALVKAQNSGG